MTSSGDSNIDWRHAEIVVKKFTEATKLHLDVLENQCKLMTKVTTRLFPTIFEKCFIENKVFSCD